MSAVSSSKNIYQDGKLFKDIDFQIMLKRLKIKDLEKSIEKSLNLAGVNGPKGSNGMGVDYSRVTSSTPVTHIGLEDAFRLIDRDRAQIIRLGAEMHELRLRKKALMKMLESLDGLEEQIFYYRVIMCKTQRDAAEIIGFSPRHLQRIEKQMKDAAVYFDV